MSLAFTAIKGAYFTGMALAFRQAVSFLTIFYVAKILHPSDFGLVAMVMVVVGFAQVIGDVGFSAGLVRARQSSQTALSTCFWIGLGIGAALTLGVFMLAPVAAWFYGTEKVEPLLRAAAVGLLVNCCLPVPLAILQQRLAYKEIASSQAAGSFIGAATTCVLAAQGFGTWSLVIQPIVGNVALLLIMTQRARWKPAFVYEYSSIKGVLGDGLNLLGTGIVQFARSNFDSFLIGSSLQSRDLGFYSLAKTVLLAPNYLITSVVSRVVFPLVAKFQDDKERVRETILTAATRTGLLVFPLYLGLWAVADDFVILVFGDAWIEIVPLIRIMALASLVQSVSSIMSPILVALGESRLTFKINFYGALIYFGALLVAVRGGLAAVAYAHALTGTVTGVATLVIIVRVARLPVARLAAAIGRPICLSLLMCGVVLGLSNSMSAGAGVVRLSVLVLSGALVYCGLVLAFERNAVQQLRSAIRS